MLTVHFPLGRFSSVLPTVSASADEMMSSDTRVSAEIAAGADDVINRNKVNMVRREAIRIDMSDLRMTALAMFSANSKNK